MIMDQDKDKNFLALTLMYHSIFFLGHFEKCETKYSRKRKSTKPVENFFKPYCSRTPPKPSYKNITIVDSDVEISSDEEWRDKK